MENSLAYSNTKPWGDMLYEEEQNRKLAYLRMPRAEWLACVNAYFNTLRGNGVALISALSWFTQMEAKRAAFNAPRTEPVVDEQTRNWRVWLDMVEEPEKYGSDIAEWLELDEELRRGPKRWRVDAYWWTKIQEMEAEQKETAAVKIQALWRGHVARTVMGERMNCGRCLKHVACHDRLEDDDIYVCRECKAEWDELWRKFGEDLAQEEEAAEVNEYMRRLAEEFEATEAREEVCDDCGEETVMYGASVAELHLCPDCVHDWEVCDLCDRAKPIGGRCDNHCRDCGEPLTGMGGGMSSGFCSSECRLEYIRDCWRDSR